MELETISERDPKVTRILTSHENGDIHGNLQRKLVTQDELPDLGEFHRRRGLRTVITSGTYDMIHVGHGRYLDLARSLGDRLFVALNSDQSVRAYKGEGRPILGEVRRAEMLAYLAAVDYIVMFDEETAHKPIELLKPNVLLIVEGSWPEGTDVKEKAEVAAMIKHCGEIFISARQDPVLSTSAIIERIEGTGKQQALTELAEIVNVRRSEVSPIKL